MAPPAGLREVGMARVNATPALFILALLAACGDRATAPDASEPSERAHLTAVEVHLSSGEIAPPGPYSYLRYYCRMLDCSVWVYVSNPGVKTRTVLIEVATPWILPPRTVLTPEDQLPTGVVKIYESAFDARQLQMTEMSAIVVRLTETSAAWGTYSEEQRIDVGF
jgi:hypothetical protein